MIMRPDVPTGRNGNFGDAQFIFAIEIGEKALQNRFVLDGSRHTLGVNLEPSLLGLYLRSLRMVYEQYTSQ
jgi:hypothetical protein